VPLRACRWSNESAGRSGLFCLATSRRLSQRKYQKAIFALAGDEGTGVEATTLNVQVKYDPEILYAEAICLLNIGRALIASKDLYDTKTYSLNLHRAGSAIERAGKLLKDLAKECGAMREWDTRLQLGEDHLQRVQRGLGAGLLGNAARGWLRGLDGLARSDCKAACETLLLLKEKGDDVSQILRNLEHTSVGELIRKFQREEKWASDLATRLAAQVESIPA
jgi:hypothetical protein